MSEVTYPVGTAVLALLLGLPGALIAGVFRWLGVIGPDAVFLVWLGSGVALTLWLTGLDG